MREYQVRICERLRVKFPGPTRQTQKSRRVTGKSALPSRTEVVGRARQVRKGPIADIKAHRAPFSSSELGEQAPRGKKVNRFEAFGKPVVNPFQQLDGLALATLIGP
jgi:hypothetical protein